MTLRAAFSSLRRQTSSGFYLPELDGLRFIAILSVFLYHLAGDVLRHSPSAPLPDSFLFRLTQQLNVGVSLFFCISGMILALPFARHYLQGAPPVPIKKYLLRRVTRLEPPYLFALLLFFLLKLAGSRGELAQMLPHLWASMGYLHNLIYRSPSTIDFVAWSLEVEIQFYLLAPLLAMVFAIRAAWLRRAIILLAAVFAAGLNAWHPSAFVRLTLAGNIQFFLMGFLLVDIFLSHPPNMRESFRWDFMSFLGWPAFACFLVFCPTWHTVVLPFFIFALYLAVFYGKLAKKFLASLWISVIGGMCYTIYLLHNYLIALAGMVTERVGQGLPFAMKLLLQFVLISPFVLLVSAIYFRLIEQPCMQPDWPTRFKIRVQRQLGISSAS